MLMRVVGRPLSLCCSFISLAFRSMSCKGKCRASAGIYKRSTNIHRESTNIYRTSESKQTSKQAGKQTSTQTRNKEKRKKRGRNNESNISIIFEHLSNTSIDILSSIDRQIGRNISISNIYRTHLSTLRQRCGGKMQIELWPAMW